MSGITRLLETVLQYANINAIFVFIALLVLYMLLEKHKKRHSNLPPGPPGLPFVGNLLSMSLHSERNMYEWNKKYGPVCRLKMASLEFILLGSVEAVEEAFVKKSDNFSDRLANSVQGITGNGGIVFLSYDNILKRQRRFGRATLREFGMGKRSIEPQILERCDELSKVIGRHCDECEAFSVDLPIYQMTSSVISQLVFNKNLASESPGFRAYLKILVEGLKYSELGLLTLFVPSLKYIPPWSWNEHESKIIEDNNYRMFQEQIDEHKQTRIPDEPRDYIDCFLDEMERIEKSGEDPSVQGFTDEQLNYTVRDLFLAGSETTATTASWAVLYLSRNPQIQEILYREIVEVFGKNQPPSTSLAEQMPFTKAVIQETLRIRPVTPIGVPHIARKDGTVMGFRIPKGAFVVSNQFRIQNDEEIWEDPEKFHPSRHLNEDGKFVKSPHVIPFSIGARQCLGLQLANMELFLIICSVFQKFSFTFPSKQKVDMRGKNIFTLRPYPFKVIATRR